jgi:plasmid stabilization system protein ParE
MEHAAAVEDVKRAAAEAARRIGRNPFLGSVRPYGPPGYRFWSLIRFHYVLVYGPQTDRLEMLRFVHTTADLPRVSVDPLGTPKP